MPEGKEAKAAPYPAWCKTPAEVQADLGVVLSDGLSPEEVEVRHAKYGFNELEKEPGTPWWKLVAEQFDDMLVKVRWGRGLGRQRGRRIKKKRCKIAPSMSSARGRQSTDDAHGGAMKPARGPCARLPGSGVFV
jgi:hypothetical protein